MSETKKVDKVVKTKSKLPFKVRFKSFIAGIKKFFRVKSNKFKSYLKSNEFQIPKNAILKILFNGLLFTVGLTYFLGFIWYLIPITGCAWYILKKELFPEIRQLISSVNLVKIQK